MHAPRPINATTHSVRSRALRVTPLLQRLTFQLLLLPHDTHTHTHTTHIQVPESFDAAEGEQLSPDLLIDKHIGSGSTADVYKLRPVSHNDDDDDDDGGKALSKGPAQV